MYRSGDFEKIAPHEGKLAEMGVPTLLLWGAADQFAPVAGAHRFAREIPHAELVVLEGAGHFVWEDEPQRSSAELARFLAALPGG
jgi:haloalkane dehalogenase